MSRGNFRTSQMRIWGIVFGIWAFAVPALAQDVPGGQTLTFGLQQRLSANDNLRLDPTSAGTTVFSDTTLSFGYVSETRFQRFDLFLDGVIRLINDPATGSESNFRDPGAELRYTRTTSGSQLTLFATYDRTDLAFSDPLFQDEVDSQDVFNGGGEREDIRAGLNLETGMQAPLGFVLGLDARERSYSDTADPLLFDNDSQSANIGVRLQFSPVIRGRVDLSEDRFSAEDTLQTRNETQSITAGMTYQLSSAAQLDLDLGRSEVVQTFDVLPGAETVTRGSVGTLAYVQTLPDGQLSASVDTAVTQRGRQTTVEFGRVFEFPSSRLEVSIGASRGDTFDARPVGRLAFSAELPRGSFNAGLTRSVAISDILSQATETTRADLGYEIDVNPLSSLAFSLYYTDISSIGAALAGTDRERGSFNATYSREVARDWELQVGYEHRYFSPQNGSTSRSNQIFFALQREFEFFR